MATITVSNRAWIVASFALLAAAPLLAAYTGETYVVSVLSRVVIFAIAAVGLNLILGFGGMVSFGHALYVGIGVYAVGILDAYGVQNGWLQLGTALVATLLVSTVLGALSLRTKGMTFIMLSLAFAQMFYYVVTGLKSFGGDSGRPLSRSSDFEVIGFDNPYALYFIALGCLALLVSVFHRVVASRFGRVIRGAKANAPRLSAIGIDVLPYQLTAYVASALVCSVAGLLLVNLTRYVAPSYMQWTASGDLIIMSLLGGMGTVFGPAVGAAAIVLLEELLTGSGLGLPRGIDEFISAHWLAVLGIFVVIVPLVSRKGLYGALLSRTQQLPAPGLTAALPLLPVHEVVDPIDSKRTAPTALLMLDGLDKRFGNVHATRNLSLTFMRGELHAIIGPNGAGKTTLVSLITGQQQPDQGRIEFCGRDISTWPEHRRARLGLARSFQVTSLFAGFTALDNVALSVQARQGHSFRFWADASKDRRFCAEAARVLLQVGLAGREDVLVESLSHGEQRQLELGMALALNPVLLVLDEPMAGMGSEDAKTMVDLLHRLKREITIILIEHDMDAVFSLADRITVLVAGHPVCTDRPEGVRQNAVVRQAYLGEEEEQEAAVA